MTVDPLAVAQQAAGRAGSLLRAQFANLAEVAVEIKRQDDAYQGLVTSADMASEQTIIDTILASFPDHQILAEETRDSTVAAATAEHLWVIDPLDGTNNFAHGLDHYAVSIAYLRCGVAQCGVIARPETAQVFWAARDRGAWQQREHQPPRQARVSPHRQLSDTMIGVGFYYDRGEMMRQTLAAIERLFEQQVHGVRRMGTASLDLVQVGLGHFGGFFEYQLAPWDIAAGRLFVELAGGQVTTCAGQSLPLESCSVLASNGLLHDLLRAAVGRCED